MPVTNGLGVNAPLSVVADTQGKTKTVILQNVSAVDVYVSNDASTLQQTSVTNLPQVGLHFPPDTAGITPFMLILRNVNAKLYGRSPGSGAQMESMILDECPTIERSAT